MHPDSQPTNSNCLREEEAFMGTEEDWPASRITARERACIDLQIPASGTPWLDDLINQRQDQDVQRALQLRLAIGRCAT